MTSTNSPSFSGSPVTSMAKPSTPESTTRPPKISASLRTAVRLSCGVRMRSRTSSRTTDGPSVRSLACSTLMSLFICLMTWARWVLSVGAGAAGAEHHQLAAQMEPDRHVMAGGGDLPGLLGEVEDRLNAALEQRTDPVAGSGRRCGQMRCRNYPR